MSQAGYIALYRKLKDSDLWPKNRPFTELEAWIDLLLSVRWKNEPCKRTDKHGVYTLGHGEILASERFLAERWGWGRKKVTGYVGRLEEMGTIAATERNHRRTVLKIVNFSMYQDQEKQKEPVKGQLGASKGPARGQTGAKEEEGNKGIKKEGNKPLPKKTNKQKTTPPNEKEWIPSKATQDKAKDHGYTKAGLFIAITNCFDWHRGEGKEKKDWDATVRNWMMPNGRNDFGSAFKVILQNKNNSVIPTKKGEEPDFIPLEEGDEF